MAARWENNAFSRACICYEAGALCCSAANIFISSSLEVLKLLHAIFVLQAKTYLHSLILSFRREWKCHCKEKKTLCIWGYYHQCASVQTAKWNFAEGGMFNVDLFPLNEVAFKLLLSLPSFLDKWYQDSKCHVWHVLSHIFVM